MKNIFAGEALSPLLKRRLAYLAITAIAAAVALTLVSLRAQALARASDGATKAAWSDASARTTRDVTPSADAVFARFGIRSNRAGAATGGADELSWQTTSSADLRASLAALDAAQVRLQQVKISRNATVFTVTAERAP